MSFAGPGGQSEAKTEVNFLVMQARAEAEVEVLAGQLGHRSCVPKSSQLCMFLNKTQEDSLVL